MSLPAPVNGPDDPPFGVGLLERADQGVDDLRADAGLVRKEDEEGLACRIQGQQTLPERRGHPLLIVGVDHDLYGERGQGLSDPVGFMAQDQDGLVRSGADE